MAVLHRSEILIDMGDLAAVVRTDVLLPPCPALWNSQDAVGVDLVQVGGLIVLEAKFDLTVAKLIRDRHATPLVAIEHHDGPFTVLAHVPFDQLLLLPRLWGAAGPCRDALLDLGAERALVEGDFLETPFLHVLHAIQDHIDHCAHPLGAEAVDGGRVLAHAHALTRQVQLVNQGAQ